MGLTELRTKHLPHITPVVLLCIAFMLANSSGPLLVWLERMQEKAKTSGLDWFDASMTIVFMGGLFGSTFLAFRSRVYTDWRNERDLQKKKDYETDLIKQQKLDEEGRLKTLG